MSHYRAQVSGDANTWSLDVMVVKHPFWIFPGFAVYEDVVEFGTVGAGVSVLNIDWPGYVTVVTRGVNAEGVRGPEVAGFGVPMCFDVNYIG
jgi:hypothetical protein